MTTRTTEGLLRPLPSACARRSSLACIAAVIALIACAQHPPPPGRLPARPQQTRLPFLGTPGEYVAAAGLRWLIVGQPRRVAHQRGVAEALAPVLPMAGVRAFAESSGVDLKELTQGAIAGYDFATLYVARVDDTRTVRARFLERLLHGPKVSRPYPKLYRASGIIGETPQTYVEVEGHLVAFAVGDPMPALAVEGYARGKLKRSPAAMEGAALRSLRDWATDAPVRAFALGPFETTPARSVHGLLRFASAVGLAVWLSERTVRALVSLSGSYPEGSLRSLERSFEDLVKSRLGALLGLDSATSPTYRKLPGRLELEVHLQLAPLVAGLHALVSANAGAIFRLANPEPGVGSSSETPDIDEADGFRPGEVE